MCSTFMCGLDMEQDRSHDQFVVAMIIFISLIGYCLTIMSCAAICAYCLYGDGGGDGGGGGGGGGDGDGGGGDGGGGGCRR
jgi:hypothetical protein